MTSVIGGEATPAAWLIGREVGAFGRIFRLIGGVGSVAYGLGGLDKSGVLPVAGYVVALALFYTVLHWLLGRRRLARLDPFVVTVLVLGPLGVLGRSEFPDALHSAVGVYVGASLVVNAVIRYGGCEVVALPTLLFRRRHVVYCPINLIDAAERPLSRVDGWVGGIAAVAALIVASYYLLVRELLFDLHVSDPVSETWSLVLLVPAATLAVRAARSRDAGWGAVWPPLLGAGALVGLALAITGFVGRDMLFGGAVLVGLVAALIRSVVTARRRGSLGAD